MTQEKKRSLVKDKKNLWLMILLLSVVVIEIWWWQREKLTVNLDSPKNNSASVPASTPVRFTLIGTARQALLATQIPG